MLFRSSQNVDGSCGSSGVGELLGNDFLVTLGGCGLSLSDSDRRNATINFQAATVMHELGHLLGFDHDDEGVMAETLATGVRRYQISSRSMTRAQR